ncbi:hypothetical protein lerEdw1_015987 [Lerista edwardsae]|nr:hypothetical protein lerEdw1_015987 [Lerista edwardsae]
MKDGAPTVVLFLLGAIVLLQGGCCGVSSHFARYFMTAVSKSVGDLSQFIAVSYVDNQLMGVYDSSRQRIVPLVPWLRKMEEEEPQLWDGQTQYMSNQEKNLRGDLITVQKRYNQSREPPLVTVTRKDSHDGLEMLLCRAHGFYPKEIDATWRRDGEVRQGDTFRGTISPNADGTYHTWLSIEVDPQERSRFRCHVEHDGLREPLDVAVEEAALVSRFCPDSARLLSRGAGAPPPHTQIFHVRLFASDTAPATVSAPPSLPSSSFARHRSPAAPRESAQQPMTEAPARFSDWWDGPHPHCEARRGVRGLQSPMGLPGWLLGAAALLLGGCSGSSRHSQSTFLMAVSEPSRGLPRFLVAGYLDGRAFGGYSSAGRRIVARVPWMERLERADPRLWRRQTEHMRAWELRLGRELGAVQRLHNQSAGFHTLQFRVGCELDKDRWKGGFAQYGYDGRDFLAFDPETLTWTAADAQAQATKWRRDADLPLCHGTRAYLEETCPEWLRKYLGGRPWEGGRPCRGQVSGAGRGEGQFLQAPPSLKVFELGRCPWCGWEVPEAVLIQTPAEAGEMPFLDKPPLVTVTRKDSQEGLETLLCRAHGFYPKEIDATWRRDGEARQGDTFWGTVSPNADGTYHTWLSIEVDPQERSRFRCHVEHDGLREPLDVAVAEAGERILKREFLCPCRMGRGRWGDGQILGGEFSPQEGLSNSQRVFWGAKLLMHPCVEGWTEAGAARNRVGRGTLGSGRSATVP